MVRMKIFSGTANKPLAEKLAHALHLTLSPIEIFVFPDGEKRIQIQEAVVDETCIVVQPTATPTAENFMELYFIIDGLKRSGASEIIAVMPYIGYQRQDHVFRTGEAVSLEVVIRMLEAVGVSRVISFDLHSVKIPEFFSVPMDHLSALPLFAETIKKQDDKLEDSCLVSPDMGGLRRIRKMSELLSNMPWVATVKERDLDTGSIVIKRIEGEKSAIRKRAFIIDDMISSGKTAVASAELLKKHGVEHISLFATHPIFSADAPEILQNSVFEKVYVTDTVFIPQEKYFPKLEVLSVAQTIKHALSL